MRNDSTTSRTKKGGRGAGRGKDRDAGMLRRKSRHLEGVTDIDYRDTNLLRKFVTEHGKIMSSRLTGATAKQQRRIATAIRRARLMGFMP